MMLQLVGCSHRTSPLEFRERLAFSPEQVPAALSQLRENFPNTEIVLLSTCNRVELYTAAVESNGTPTQSQLVEFLAAFHGLRTDEIEGNLFQFDREDAIAHLFNVAASLDSMVMGEAQILSQVKEAYRLATDGDFTGPLTHAAFQGAIRVARRVASETAIHQKRVSIPSVAVADFASQIFERFDDKKVLVIARVKWDKRHSPICKTKVRQKLPWLTETPSVPRIWRQSTAANPEVGTISRVFGRGRSGY